MNKLYALIKAYIESGGNAKNVQKVLKSFTEAPTKRITAAERLGLPKGDRGNLRENVKAISIPMTSSELGQAISEVQGKNGFYIYGHGTGRSNPNARRLMNSGLRVPNGETANTAIGLSDNASEISQRLQHWPHLDSKEIMLLPANADQFTNSNGYMYNMDWFPEGSFEYVVRSGKSIWDPSFEGYVPILQGDPVAGQYLQTKPQAPLGVFNNETNQFLTNMNNQYFSVIRDINGNIKIVGNEDPLNGVKPFRKGGKL